MAAPQKKPNIPVPSTALHGTSTPPISIESMFASPGGRMARGVIDGLLGVGALNGHIGHYVTSFGGLAPNIVSDKFFRPMAFVMDVSKKGLDQTADVSIHDATDTPGYRAIAPSYAAHAHKMLSTDAFNIPAQYFAPVVPGAMGMLGYAGGALIPVPGVKASDSAHAMMDTTTHEMGDWEAKHPVASIVIGLAPLAGGSLSIGGRLARTHSIGDIDRSIGEIDALAHMSFRKFDQTGMEIKKRVVNGLANQIKKLVAKNAEHGDITSPEFAELYPKTLAILDRIKKFAESATGPKSLQAMHQLRQAIRDAAEKGASSKLDRTVIREIADHFDDFIKDLHKDQLVVPKTFNKTALGSLERAQKLWGRSAKAQLVQGTINKAIKDAEDGYKGGLPAALQERFRKLSRNSRAMERFEVNEKALIKAVAEGTKAHKILTMAGRFSPSMTPEGIGGMIAAVTSIASGQPYGVAIPAAGAIARVMAGNKTKESAARVMNTILKGDTKVRDITTPSIISATALPALWAGVNIKGRPETPEKPDPQK
jgi:hypothetical protein